MTASSVQIEKSSSAIVPARSPGAGGPIEVPPARAQVAMRVLIVAEHASARFGGEAALPLHYFRVLRQRGAHVWLVTHARTRPELTSLFPDETRIHYIEDTWVHRLMWRLGSRLPDQISYFTTGFVGRLTTQLAQRRIVRRLVGAEGIEVIHQPMPVSPREPSMIFGFGVPVVIGPMNGGMEYPPYFRKRRGTGERCLLGLARWFAEAMNRLMPGKRRAACLLVANARTEAALPRGVNPRVLRLVENGVDLGLWRASGILEEPLPPSGAPVTFVFLGRLVGWKAVELLILAFAKARSRTPMRLLIIGDGDERPRLESVARSCGVLAAPEAQAGTVQFTGWMVQSECAKALQAADCLVLPSLLECGGAVVLEAMSMSKPVIATEWGGPADYLDPQCGVLISPADRETMIEGFAEAMRQLASSPADRQRLGAHGLEKVRREYDWEVKIDRIAQIYEQAIHDANQAVVAAS